MREEYNTWDNLLFFHTYFKKLFHRGLKSLVGGDKDSGRVNFCCLVREREVSCDSIIGAYCLLLTRVGHITSS